MDQVIQELHSNKGASSVPLPERPRIPEILVDATLKAIRAGMRPDEFTRAVQSQVQKDRASLDGGGKGGGGKGRRARRKSERLARRRQSRAQGGEEEVEEEEGEGRTYRNLDERQMGLLLLGDQHRFGGKWEGLDRFLFPTAVPLDYSFSMLERMEEIVTEGEQPHEYRNFGAPPKTQEDRYMTSSMWLSYNVIESLDGLVNVLYKILDGGPVGISWLDLSFNAINKLDEDVFSQLPNLKILYMHGNGIVDMTEIPKLKALASLHALTLHGNPVEEEEGYRMTVLFHLPRLLHLDFVGVTKRELEASRILGPRYDPYWVRRHEEIEAFYKSQRMAAEVSYTDKVMEAEKGAEGANGEDQEEAQQHRRDTEVEEKQPTSTSYDHRKSFKHKAPHDPGETQAPASQI